MSYAPDATGGDCVPGPSKAMGDPCGNQSGDVVPTQALRLRTAIAIRIILIIMVVSFFVKNRSLPTTIPSFT